MRALVVGAGAVGQVFGRHLALGGAEVAFLVRPKYAEECRRGFTLYRLNRRGKGRTTPERFAGFGVLTASAEVAASAWDQIYITVSSPALRAGSWLEELARASGDATVVSLQPGLHDRDFVGKVVGHHRLVSGLISLISYQAPLPGETRFPEPGMAYWFPPLSPSPFSGAAGEVTRPDAVVQALRAGGQPAKRHADVPRSAAFPGAILMSLLAALEGAGWTFAGIRRGGFIRLASRGSQEAMAIAAREVGLKPPLGPRLLRRPLMLRALLRLAPLVVPLDLETYFRVHFTKVGDQTKMALGEHIASGKAAGLPTAALEELQRYVVVDKQAA